MRQSLLTRLMLALAATLAGVLAVAAYAAPTAQEASPSQAASAIPARVSVVHAAPFDASDTEVTLTATSGGETALIQRGFSFGSVVPYLSLPAGDYELKLFAGSRALSETLTLTPALTTTVSLAADTDYTAVAVGTGVAPYPLDIRVFEDDFTAPTAGQGLVRLVHAAPFVPAPGGPAQTEVRVVDVGADPDVTLVDSLVYSNTTGFVPLASGVYSVTVESVPLPGTTIFGPADLPVVEGSIVTYIAVGGANSQAPNLIALPFAPRGGAQLRVVHAAPFASGAATASVVIDRDFNPGGNLSLPGLNFKGSTLYRPLGPGTYTFKLYAGGVITGTPVLTESLRLTDGATLTAVIVGTNTPTYPLALDVLVDRREAAGSATADARVFHAAPFGATPAQTGVDIVAQDGSPLSPAVANLLYRQNTGYVTLPSGLPLDLKVVLTGTSTAVIDPPALTLPAGSVSTVIAVGGANGQTPDLLILNDLQATEQHFLPWVAR